MTSRTGNKEPNASVKRTPRQPGFTLIELVLVMAMLLIVLSLAAPSLARFFRGRTLDFEAKRFLALTRYAQSRAVSEGAPMLLWIDVEQRAYGLEIEASYAEEGTQTNRLQFTLGERLEVEVEVPEVKTSRPMPEQIGRLRGEVPFIRFAPDGFIDETSPTRVLFREPEAEAGAILVGQSINRLNYEIQTNNVLALRR
jgi:type II secretion system protein H